MVANIGPADYNYEETLSTLRYANRAKTIANKPRINQDPKDAMLREFEEEIQRLRAQLASKDKPRPARVVEQVGISAVPYLHARHQSCCCVCRVKVSAGPETIQPFVWLQVVEQAAGAETVAAVRDAMRAELEASMREAASAEAIAQARAEAQVHAQKQLAALMAQQAAGECAASASTGSTADHQSPEADTLSAAGWEDTERARKALEVQQAELAHYADEIAAEREEGLVLEAKIRALEGKVSSAVLLVTAMQTAVP